MQYRTFGRTDLLVSEIGFGAWAIGGNAMVGNTAIGWGQADDQVSKEAILSALDAGINFFDTADFYGLGHSESLLGEVLEEHKDVLIATKVGHRSLANTIVLDYSKEYIIGACEDSLRRLKRDAIDYYQLHSARLKHLEQGACVDAMETLKKQGKIRYWGLSLNTFHPGPEADYLMEHRLGDGLQLVFNLVNQRAMGLIEKASEQGYGLIARMPFQFGLLTGKFSGSATFEKDDHRSSRLTPEILQRSLAILAEKVWPIALAERISRTALALNFILSLDAISTVIPGIRTKEHVLQNTGATKRLDAIHFKYLQSLAEQDWKPVLELMEKQG
jgi:aryl-alcohol dehydrogenase-like predicted oxidoreductase